MAYLLYRENGTYDFEHSGWHQDRSFAKGAHVGRGRYARIGQGAAQAGTTSGRAL
jgi:hypothetical protein